MTQFHWFLVSMQISLPGDQRRQEEDIIRNHFIQIRSKIRIVLNIEQGYSDSKSIRKFGTLKYIHVELIFHL